MCKIVVPGKRLLSAPGVGGLGREARVGSWQEMRNGGKV